MVSVILILLPDRTAIDTNDPDHPGIVQIRARLAEGNVSILSDPDTGDMDPPALLDEPGVFPGNSPRRPRESFQEMDLFRPYMVKKMLLQVNRERVR